MKVRMRAKSRTWMSEKSGSENAMAGDDNDE